METKNPNTQTVTNARDLYWGAHLSIIQHFKSSKVLFFFGLFSLHVFACLCTLLIVTTIVIIVVTIIATKFHQLQSLSYLNLNYLYNLYF